MNIEQGIKDNFIFLNRVCRKYTKDYEESQLLKSIVLEKIWKNRDKFEGNSGDFIKWISVIAINAAKDQYRIPEKRCASFLDLDTVSVHPKTEDLFNQFSNKILIDKIIKKVEDNFDCIDVLVFKLVAIEGYKYKEASIKLNIPIGTLKSMLFYIRKFLVYNRRVKLLVA